jgi:phosphoribosylanthranilate isomerase
MNEPAIKICGITCLEDGLAALQAGAGLLGFNFYPPSPRCLTADACARLVSELRACGGSFLAVGVFVNHPANQIAALLERCGLDLAQLSGDEPPQTLAVLGRLAFKALRPGDAAALQADLEHYPARPAAPAFLVDAYRPGQYGGTGEVADWGLAAGLARQQPILLAGGLNPGNVAAAIRQVRPWGVDVASGVERTPGRKDAGKMAAFVQAALQAAGSPARSPINDEEQTHAQRSIE